MSDRVQPVYFTYTLNPEILVRTTLITRRVGELCYRFLAS